MRQRLTVVFLLCSAVATAGAVAQSNPSTIGIESIRPGMKGWGTTVFRGTEPQRFEVEVIDVLHRFRPDQDLILVRTEHPVLEHATTVAGMSGSPIYLDGRLAGAYAYGWPFGKDPVIGVTPADRMLEEMGRPLRPGAFPGSKPLATRRASRPNKAKAKAKARQPSHPRFAGLPPYGRDEVRSPLDLLDAHAHQHADRSAVHRGSSPRALVPAATPVMLGGFTDAVSGMLDDALEPYGLVPLQAGGGSAARRGDEPADFEAGGPIAVQLIRGDVTATAIGTVTHVGSDRLIAFGHPMMNAGEIGLPTAGARVLHILASQNRSFKIAEATQPRGTLIHDRQSAIVVDKNLEAATVPVTIRVHGVDGAPRTKWEMEVASHRVLTPVLTFASIANALQATVPDQADVVYTAESRVDVVGQSPVEVVDRGFASGGAASARALTGLRMFRLMDAAFANPFEQSRVKGVELDLHLRFARDVVRVLNVAVASDEVDPGSTVNLYVTTQRLDGEPHVRIVPIDIPARAAGEKVEIQVQPGDEVDLELPEPGTLGDLLRGITAGLPATSLVASLQMPTRGLRFRGHVVRALPPSALDSLQLANSSDGDPFVTHERKVIDAGSVVAGSAKVELEVRETPRR